MKKRAPGLGRDAFPALRNFVRGYLHEDFPEVHGSIRAAAAAFCADATPAERQLLVSELEALTNTRAGRTARELRRFVTDALGSRWEPASRAELVELLDVLRAHQGSREKGEGTREKG